MKVNRLEASITVSMVGFLADYSITQWMIYGLTGFSESNTLLLPQIGLPLMVLNFLLADRLLPRSSNYDNLMYTMALLQWTGPIQNVLVLFKVTQGLSFFSVVPPFLVATYLILHFRPVLGDRLRYWYQSI